MRKIFQAATLSLVLAFSLYGVAFGADITGANPCGTESAPVNEISPVQVGVDSVTGAASYDWYVDGAFNRNDPKSSTQLDFGTKGKHFWYVLAKDSGDTTLGVSGFCYVDITEICPIGTVCIPNPLQVNTFFDLLTIAENVLFTFALILSPIMVLYAAFLLVAGGDNPQNRTKAINILIWTVVGFLVILFSKGAVLILQSIFPSSGFASPGSIFTEVENVTNWIFTILLVASVFSALLAAFQFITSGQDPKQVAGAKDKILYAAVGIVIALFAKAVPVILQNIIK